MCWNIYYVRAIKPGIDSLKFVSRQAASNNYVDQAFTGYDRMVVDIYLEDPNKGFQAGDMICVSSNTWVNATQQISKRKL